MKASAKPRTTRRKAKAEGKEFLEFFAGMGLVREGLAESGWNCVYANDNDPRKQALYEERFGVNDLFHNEDIRQTEKVVDRIGRGAFLATASFPCNDLSLAGRYRGFKGKKSSAFFAFISVLEGLGDGRPKAVLVENVMGLLTARKGEDFKRVAHALADLGYWLDSFLLNASHFTPQSRPRLFVLAVQKSLKPGRSVGGGAPLPPRHPELTSERLENYIQTIRLPTGWVRFPLPRPPRAKSTLQEVLELGEEAQWWDDRRVDKVYKAMSDRHRRLIRDKLVSREDWVATIRGRTRKGQVMAEVRSDGLAGCLLTPRGGGARQVVVSTRGGVFRMRWLTTLEYGRLQGANDGERPAKSKKRHR